MRQHTQFGEEFFFVSLDCGLLCCCLDRPVITCWASLDNYFLWLLLWFLNILTSDSIICCVITRNLENMIHSLVVSLLVASPSERLTWAHGQVSPQMDTFWGFLQQQFDQRFLDPFIFIFNSLENNFWLWNLLGFLQFNYYLKIVVHIYRDNEIVNALP